MRYIVELEPGVWLAPWSGDPGRTLVKKEARRFKSRGEATQWMGWAKTFRPFPHARVVEVEEVEG